MLSGGCSLRRTRHQYNHTSLIQDTQNLTKVFKKLLKKLMLSLLISDLALILAAIPSRFFGTWKAVRYNPAPLFDPFRPGP